MVEFIASCSKPTKNLDFYFSYHYHIRTFQLSDY